MLDRNVIRIFKKNYYFITFYFILKLMYNYDILLYFLYSNLDMMFS